MVSKHWPTVSDRRAYLYPAVLNEALVSRRSLTRRRRREAPTTLAEAVTDEATSPEVLEALPSPERPPTRRLVLTSWEDLGPSQSPVPVQCTTPPIATAVPVLSRAGWAHPYVRETSVRRWSNAFERCRGHWS